MVSDDLLTVGVVAVAGLFLFGMLGRDSLAFGENSMGETVTETVNVSSGTSGEAEAISETFNVDWDAIKSDPTSDLSKFASAGGFSSGGQVV